MKELVFEVFSGGRVTVDLKACDACETKACIEVCSSIGNGDILELGPDGRPRLRIEPDDARRGGCIEDMGCLLACRLRGQGAVAFHLPTPELDATLGTAPQPAYQRTTAASG